MEHLAASQNFGRQPAHPAAASPRMPALAVGTHSHHHTVHSALATLDALGISAHRVSIERTGREAVPPGTVVRQYPAPGVLMLPDTRVRLQVAGLGFSHALPVGMWDSGSERELGTRELLEGIDDPLEKLKHWFHEGAPLFRVSPEDPAACARWLTLFGVEPQMWPKRMWYTLATLVAKLPQYSCSQQGCAFVLESLLGLPVERLRYRPNWSHLPDAMCSGLGRRSSRLGVDLLLGDQVEETASLEIEIGPVSIELYEYFAETEEGRTLLRQLLDMIAPVSTRTEVRWSVLDRSRPPQLGVRDGNSRLGINTHMGSTLAAKPAQAGTPASGTGAERDATDRRSDPHSDLRNEEEQPAVGVLQL